MSASSGLPPCSPGSKANAGLSPGPAPGLVPALPPISGRHPRLHLAPGFCPQSCQSLGSHHPVRPHTVAVCIKQSGHRDRWAWDSPPGPPVASLHLGLPGRVLLTIHSGGCPYAWPPPNSWPGVPPSTFMSAGGWGHFASFVTWHGLEGLWGTVRRRGHLKSILLVPDPG